VFFLPIGRFDAALKGHEMESFQPGDRVFAKVRGYPPWPARVDGTTQVQGKTRFHVFFYGTYEVAPPIPPKSVAEASSPKPAPEEVPASQGVAVEAPPSEEMGVAA